MAEATAAEMPSDDMGLMMDAEEMKKDSGKKAVRVSRTLAKMKSAEVAGKTGGTVREVGNKTFNWKDGGWVDEAATKGKRIKVKPYSQAYFDLAKASKLVSSYLALGDKVTFEWKGFVIEIADDGVETLPADLKKKM